MYRQRSQGFTLAELLAAIAIVGILSAIAIPNYTSYTAKSYFSDGREDVYRVMTQQERYFMNNMKYTSTLGDGGIGYTVNSDGKLTSPGGHFLLSAGVCELAGVAQTNVNSCVRISANGINKQDGVLIWLQSDGAKSTNIE